MAFKIICIRVSIFYYSNFPKNTNGKMISLKEMNFFQALNFLKKGISVLKDSQLYPYK